MEAGVAEHVTSILFRGNNEQQCYYHVLLTDMRLQLIKRGGTNMLNKRSLKYCTLYCIMFHTNFNEFHCHATWKVKFKLDVYLHL